MSGRSSRSVDARHPRLCVTEFSVFGLSVAAIAVSALLWLAIVLVL